MFAYDRMCLSTLCIVADALERREPDAKMDELVDLLREEVGRQSARRAYVRRSRKMLRHNPGSGPV
jgi:hypothetical protein